MEYTYKTMNACKCPSMPPKDKWLFLCLLLDNTTLKLRITSRSHPNSGGNFFLTQRADFSK